jgi:acetylornithine deacetylase/succinyl-diaminopimelate desuccinylase-like protein
MSDPAEDVIVHLIKAMRAKFTPTSSTPPRGGGSHHVRFLAADAVPLAAWDAHAEGCGCAEPFLWVRLIQRYRTTTNSFPAPFIGVSNCGAQRALEIEVGIARCAAITENGEAPEFKTLDEEAMVALDDSRRLDAAMCAAMKCATDADSALKTAVGPVIPWGPSGGVIAHVGTVWAQIIR